MPRTVAFLLAGAAPSAGSGAWHLPEWLAPDPQKIGLVLLRLGLTLLAAFVAQRGLFLLVGRVEQWLLEASHSTGHSAQRARTLGQIFRHAATAATLSWAAVHGLDILGWDVKPLLVGASILGASLGFGAQFLVRDVIAGTFIFVEDQFVVGDTIEVNGQAATVEAVTLRSTRLRDFQGRELHVPNGEMKIVVNHSRGWNRAIVDVPVAPAQDMSRVLDITHAVAEELNQDAAWRDLLVEPFVVMGLERVGPDGAMLRMVARTRPGGDAARLAREARLRLLQRWKEAGIHTTTPLAAGRRPEEPLRATESLPPGSEP